MMIIEDGKKVLRIEKEAISALIDRIDEKFVSAVNIIDECKGRVVVTGMGKSGIIGKKISSTFSSIGIPAFFLHPAEGVHGDLGMLTHGDVVIAISNSGQTSELLNILPTIKRMGLKLISMTGNISSTLAKISEVTLDISVKEEACPWDIVPTASTTATMAMGDALAIAILNKKGVKQEDFASFHPGGSLGKNILVKVQDIMVKGELVPIVSFNASFDRVIEEITKKKKGVTSVVDKDGRLIGIVTDGDLRRAFSKGSALFDLTAEEIMSLHPKTIEEESLAAKGVKIMEDHSITSLMIIDEKGRPKGIIHLHDILKTGII